MKRPRGKKLWISLESLRNLTVDDLHRVAAAQAGETGPLGCATADCVPSPTTVPPPLSPKPGTSNSACSYCC